MIKAYNITHIPTLLLLEPDGTEIDRIIDLAGFKRKQFLNFLKDSYKDINTYPQLRSVYERDPDNIELSYRLFKKNIQRGDFEGIMSIGRKILDRPDLSKERTVSDISCKVQVTIYDDTRRHIRVTIHRSSRENILKTIPEFPEVKFSERVYKFVARTYISGLESKKAERFFENALTHYPESTQLKTLYLEWQNKRVLNR